MLFPRPGLRWLVPIAVTILVLPAIAWYLRPAPYLAIQNATPLTILEGLPHPVYEAASFDEQRKLPNTTILASFPFYTDPLIVTSADLERIRHLLATGTALEAHTGEKKWGGFHPDYAVRWNLGAGIYLALICFGCGEVRIDGPDQASLIYDLRSHGQHGQSSELFTILRKYRANRPPHDRFGPLGLSVIHQQATCT